MMWIFTQYPLAEILQVITNETYECDLARGMLQRSQVKQDYTQVSYCDPVCTHRL